MDLKKSLLTVLYNTRSLMRLGLKLVELPYLLAKIPFVRCLYPWMDPEKNMISLVPVNVSLRVKSVMLPHEVVSHFIDRAKHLVIMKSCGCRVAGDCRNNPHDIGCLFMGEAALDFPGTISRRVSREEAHRHLERAMEAGLVPMIGKARVDNFIFMTPDRGRLLSVCFCCRCCCMMGFYRHMPGEHLDRIMKPIDGLEISVKENCSGCGVCVEYCRFDAIRIVSGRDLDRGRAVHDEKCRGCGRCERHCPEGAVEIRIRNERFREDMVERISSFVDVS
jgi:UDP-glucose 4-epimerase